MMHHNLHDNKINGRGFQTKHLKDEFYTLTTFSVSGKSLSTITSVRTISVGAICVFVAGTGIRGTLINVCGERGDVQPILC